MEKKMKKMVAVVTAATKEKRVKASGNTLTVLSIKETAVTSSYRKTNMAGVKVTYAAKVLDDLLDKKISVLADNKSVVIRINFEGKEYNGHIGKDTQSWNEDVPDYVALAGDVIWTMVHSEDHELMDAARKVAAMPGKTVQDAILLFCDSYFFFDKSKEITVNSDFEPETVNAAVRRGLLTDTPLTKLFGLSQPEMEEPDYKGEEKKTESTENLIDECKAGKYRVNYTWREDQKPYIYDSALLDKYVPTETFRNILQKIKFRTDRVISRMENGADNLTAIGQDCINLTLTGKPGTGKTAMIYAISGATGLPVYTTSASHNTDEDEFEGKTKMVDGHPAAVPTDALKAFKYGGICLIEEANLPQAAVIMGALGQAVEFPYILKENGYETIRRHPLCIFVTTMNVGTIGAKPMSQPFANRFRQTYVLNDPDREVFIRILQEKTGESAKTCKWVFSAYESVLKCLEKNDAVADVDSIRLALSMRSCIGAIENIQEGIYPKDAVRDSIVGKVAEQDMEMYEICLRAVDALPDLR